MLLLTWKHQVFNIKQFNTKAKDPFFTKRRQSSYSSLSSSIIVSKLGELEVLAGEMKRAGATSIQELKHLISLAIAASKTSKPC